ncbi:MAG: lysylphosphatidylglycerol synthase transmembrane domain-containing protein [Chloroflexota bacterium]
MRLALPFAVSAALLYLVVHSVQDQADQIGAALRSADWRYLLPAVALYFLGVWIRSARWGVLLPGYHTPVSSLFRALIVGFTVNNLLPLRLGEVARAYLLARWAAIPYGTTVASLVVERVLDGLSLAILLLVALLVVPAPGYLLVVGALAVAGFLVGAGVLALAAWRASAVARLAAVVARVLPHRVGALLVRLTENFARSLALVHDPRRLARLLGLSLLAWCSELGLFYMLLISFGFSNQYPVALLVGSAANFATLVPSSPGYVGTFDSVLIRVLQDVTGVTTGQAAAFDVIVHLLLFVPVVLVGVLVLSRSHVSFGQITRSGQTTPGPQAGTDWQTV